MSGTAICNPEEQRPKQTGAYESAEAQELLVSLAQAEPRISQVTPDTADPRTDPTRFRHQP